jgi:hypothetical protein
MPTYKVHDEGSDEWITLAQGPRGVPGPPGPAGVGLSIQGELDSTDDLPETGDPGDAWLIDGSLWAWAEDTEEWVDAGPVGTPGEPGEQGEIGPPGTTDYTELDNLPTLGGAAALDVGTTEGTVAAGDDSRFTDSREPTAHADTHASDGDDPLAPADIGAATSAQGALADTALQVGGTVAVGKVPTVTDDDPLTVEWAAASGGGGTATPLPVLQSWQFLDGAGAAAAPGTIALNSTGMVRYESPSLCLPRRITDVSIEVTTLQAGSGVRVGLFRVNPANGELQTLLADLGVVDSGSTGVKEYTGLTLDITEPMWISPAIITDNTGVVVRSRVVPGTSWDVVWGTVNTVWRQRGFTSEFAGFTSPPLQPNGRENGQPTRWTAFKWTELP